MDQTEILLIVIVVAAAVIISLLAFFFANKKDKWVSQEQFEEQKRLMQPRCSEETFLKFLAFLQSYQGGYVRRRQGKIVHQDYLGKEKGDLKGIFYHVIVPNPNLHIYQKEQFRSFLLSIGVTGVANKPQYESRDAALTNKETDAEAYQRKDVGNRGELAVRSALLELKLHNYTVINGAKLRCGEQVREYDHIVVGKGGLFVIETKAFGMANGKPAKAGLFIDPGDHWILRKNQTNRELTSPTEQINAETAHLSQILRTCPVTPHPIVVLSNTELNIKQNIELPYQVVRLDALIQTITAVNDRLTDNDVREILFSIDESRRN